MKKLTGTDIITLMKSSIKDDSIKNDLANLDKKDFDSDDMLVNFFYKVYPKGFSSASFQNTDKKTVTAFSSLMSKIKSEICNQGLRKSFNLLQNIKNANNKAVEVDNKFNDYSPIGDIDDQFKAAKIVRFLSKYISGADNKIALSNVYNQINSFEIDKATEGLHSVYARTNPSKNIKLAFTTLKNQVGEPYQMCPKGIYIWGNPVPMALSDCRDYCIDSKKQPDGTVSCNYLKWLNDTLITSEQAMNLFDKITVDHETMNLEKGQRTKYPKSEQDPLDSKIIRKDKLVDESFENQLDKNRTKNSETKNTKKILSDKAIEALLKDSREVFEDDELVNLESLIREAVGE